MNENSIIQVSTDLSTFRPPLLLLSPKKIQMELFLFIHSFQSTSVRDPRSLLNLSGATGIQKSFLLQRFKESL